MGEINWTLLQELAAKPHKHMNIVAGAQYGLVVNGAFDNASNGVAEVMAEARAVQHLCDLAGIAEGDGAYEPHIDARVYLLLAESLELRERLARIIGWHARETADGGMVGDYCTECGERWPCDTRRMAEGTYGDPDGGEAAREAPPNDPSDSWRVHHPGIGILTYPDEAARVAAGTAGTVYAPGASHRSTT